MIGSVCIFNMSGCKVKSAIGSSATSQKIDVSELHAGVYFAKVIGLDGRVLYSKFLKE